MPCFSTSILSDDQLMDIRAYIATFPPDGYLGGPQDQPATGTAREAPVRGACAE